MTDTWGIPGPTFLLFFVTAIVAASVAATIARRVIFAGSSTGAVARPTPHQVAYLNGGAERAICASITGLRAHEAVGSEAGGVLVRTGALPAGASALDTAIHHAAGRRIRAQDLRRDPWVVQAVDQLRQEVERSGYGTTTEQRVRARTWSLLPAGVVLLGVLRLVAGVAGDKPVGNLVLLLVVAVVAAVVALVKANRKATFAAGRALRQIRTDSRHLAPSMTPSLTTYGATAAAMGVAVFGAASLYAMDPAFAAEAEIQRVGAGGPLGGGSSGGSCGGGSSCGGGGCGGGGCGG